MSECVECGLPHSPGWGDGIGSCNCPRCDCGECRYCADAFSCHGEACRDGNWDGGGYGDEDDPGAWLDENPARPTETVTVQKGLF